MQLIFGLLLGTIENSFPQLLKMKHIPRNIKKNCKHLRYDKNMCVVVIKFKQITNLTKMDE